MPTATYVTNRGLKMFMNGEIVPGTTDLRLALIKNEVAAATGRDHNTLNTAIAAGTEADCTGYARYTLASGSVTEDDSNDRADIDFADASFGALGGASNCQISQAILYKYNASDSSAEVVAYIGSSSMPFTTNGSTFTLTITNLLRATSTAS